MGGVIIRAALPHLEEFKDFMFSYMSVSSPHLGMMFCKSALVRTGEISCSCSLVLGLSLYQRFSNTKSIDQLNFADAKDIKNCFMYQLKSVPLEYNKNDTPSTTCSPTAAGSSTIS